MELTTLLILVAALACPIGMGVMMWLMNKNMSGQPGHSMPDQQTPAQRLSALRTQRQQLEAEIAEVARLAELEAKREALLVNAKAEGSTKDEASVSATAGTAS